MALRRERMRLGDLLIRQDVLSEEKLKKALELQKGTGKKIGEVLVENGFITEEMIARALQTQLGLKMIELTGVTIPKEVRNLVSVNLLKKYQCIPFELDPYNANILHLAMSDPMDMAAIDDISIVTNLQVEPYIATPRDILAAIDRCYGASENMDAARRFTREREQLRGNVEEAAETESTRFYMTDQTSWASDEANTLEKDMTYYINVRDYNMVSADLSQEELDKQEMTVQFYIEDENGSVEDGCPTTKNVSDITAQIGSLSGYGNIGTIESGSDGKFHLSQNSAYALKVSDIEQYLRNQNGSNGYKESCKLYAKVSSTVYLYGQEHTSTVWSSIDLKQRQLFELD